MIEEWRDIRGYEGRYVVSNTGRVRSLDWIQRHWTGSFFLKKGKEITVSVGTAFNGYSYVALTAVEGKQKGYFMHRIIAEAFVINTEGKPFVNHKNGIKTDNRVENLEWVTRSENTLHAIATGLQKVNKGSKHGMSIFTEPEVIDIRNRHSLGESSYKIFKSIGGSYTNIKDIIARRTWKHI